MATFNFVIYHKNCIDGFSGVFCLYYSNKLDKDVKIYGTQPSSDEIPKNIKGKNVVIVDVGYKPSVLKEIIKLANKVVYIDHHITHIDEIKKIDNTKLEIIYDEKHSASVLVWKYCSEKPIPLLFKLIEDNDIGKWEYEETIPFILAIHTVYDFNNIKKDNLDKFSKYLEQRNVKTLIETGKYYYEYRKYLTKKVMYKYSTKKFDFNGRKYNVAVINGDSVLGKDAITNISTLPDIDFGILWYYAGTMFYVILRSNKTNVSDIAKKYGGGGHMYAAAFSTNIFPETLLFDNK